MVFDFIGYVVEALCARRQFMLNLPPDFFISLKVFVRWGELKCSNPEEPLKLKD